MFVRCFLAPLALALFGICAAAGRSFWRGWLAATLYAWNPGALFDVAYWGQMDSVPSLWLALALMTAAAIFESMGHRTVCMNCFSRS